jgi:hypothetical protein
VQEKKKKKKDRGEEGADGVDGEKKKKSKVWVWRCTPSASGLTPSPLGASEGEEGQRI